MTIFVEMVQKRRLQQGFCQNHARASYSWSPVPGRAGFSSVHWILWAKPKLWQTCLTWGLFLGSQKSISGFVAVGPHCIWRYLDIRRAYLYIYIYVYIRMHSSIGAWKSDMHGDIPWPQVMHTVSYHNDGCKRQYLWLRVSNSPRCGGYRCYMREPNYQRPDKSNLALVWWIVLTRDVMGS